MAVRQRVHKPHRPRDWLNLALMGLGISAMVLGVLFRLWLMMCVLGVLVFVQHAVNRRYHPHPNRVAGLQLAIYAFLWLMWWMYTRL
jgi:hypothetical protein